MTTNEPVDDLNDSFHSDDYHPLRKKFYKCNNICRNFTFAENSIWLLNDINVSKSLNEFGEVSIFLHDQGDALSDIRLLSLDHIYALSPDITLSATKYLGQDAHFKIIEELIPEGIQLFPSVESVITESCTNMSLLNKSVSWSKMMELASNVIENTRSKNMETVLFGSIIYKTVTMLGSMVSISDTEDTFIHNCVHNLLSSTFGCDRYFIQEWANRSLEINKSYQPDWCVSVKIWKKKYNIIVAEAKPKNKQNRGLISDFVKLGRELKVMLEEVIKSGAEDPEVFGMLVKGSVLDVYMMDMKTDGIYRLVEIDTLNLVSNYTEMINLVRTLPLLYQLKQRVLSMAKRIEKVELAKAKDKIVGPSMPLEWFRKSVDPKMTVVS